VQPGVADELRGQIEQIVRFISEREPQLIAYAFYLDEAATRMTVFALHPDSASLEYHMEVGGPGFQKFSALIRLRSIEVYGSISERAHELLRAKATMLGGANITVDRLESGFTRLPK
jgi:hypothetical protein